MKSANTKPYPAISTLPTSNLYRVYANGKRVWTRKVVSDLDIDALPAWFGAPYVRVPQEMHIASFACSGEQVVRIEVDSPVEAVRIRPVNHKVQPSVDSGAITFSLSGPGQIVVEIPGRPWLFLFLDPEESDSPLPDDATNRFFGPGVHYPGKIELCDGQSVYFAPGSVVHGRISAKGASDIRIGGSGILVADGKSGAIHLERCRRVSVEGLTIENNGSWTNHVWDCRDVVYENVKVISFGPTGDGISPLGTIGMRISRCFLRCTDDCIAIKSPKPDLVVEDVLIEKSTMIGFAYSDGVTIGFETKGTSISNVVVRDCDILMSRGGSRVNGHSAFSIICDGPADIHDILYENIRVEDVDEKLFELHITDGSVYGAGTPGYIRNIRVKDVNWAVCRPIVIRGHDGAHRVSGVTFENCLVAGEPLVNRNHPSFKIGPFVVGLRLQ